VWRFYERKHPHSLWHGDFMEKVTLADTGQTAYQLTLLDDYARAYVYCALCLAPTVLTTIRALCCAMRAYETIPRAVLFDNGRCFREHLLVAFCANLNIRLIHTSVHHPQTNGKLERAFRDDMRECYQQQADWRLLPLQLALRDYVHYRNHVRGHMALGGQPSSTRLREQHFFALPAVLDRLEDYAEYELCRDKVMPADGCLRLLGRAAYIDRRLGGEAVRLVETYRGIEVRSERRGRYLLRDYQFFRQCRQRGYSLPQAFCFEHVTDLEASDRLHIAGAL
jgi:hypothetical protein